MNRNPLLIVFSLLLFCSVSGVSQSGGSKSLHLKTALFSEYALLPGLTVGVEQSLLKNQMHSIHVGAELSSIYNPRNYAVVDIEPFFGYRLTLPFGLVFQIQTGIGYLHFFPLVKYLRRTGEGNWEYLQAWGMSAVSGHISVGLGWDFTLGTSVPVSFFCDVRLVAQYPHTNGFILIRPVLLIGAWFAIPVAAGKQLD